MGRVEEKFLAECKIGTKAIIRDFPFPNLKPNQIYNRKPTEHAEKSVAHISGNSKWGRFRLLMASILHFRRPIQHELYIYIK